MTGQSGKINEKRNGGNERKKEPPSFYEAEDGKIVRGFCFMFSYILLLLLLLLAFFPSSLLPLPLMKTSPDFCASKKTCHLPDSFECGSLVLIGLGGHANLHLAPSASDAHRRASLPALCLAGNRADASACDSNPPPFSSPVFFQSFFFFFNNTGSIQQLIQLTALAGNGLTGI